MGYLNKVGGSSEVPLRRNFASKRVGIEKFCVTETRAEKEEKHQKKAILVTFEAETFSDIAKIALKRNISRRFLAGEEGFEPSAYGFGDRRSTS